MPKAAWAIIGGLLQSANNNSIFDFDPRDRTQMMCAAGRGFVGLRNWPRMLRLKIDCADGSGDDYEMAFSDDRADDFDHF